MSKHNNPFKKQEEIEEMKNEVEQSQETTETVKETSAENNKLQEEYDKLDRQYLRLAADFDNYRKRQEQEREGLLKFGTENALKKMLEVIDNFERGEKALENVEDCQQVKDSFNLVYKQTVEVLQKLGLEEIDATGKEFDPNFHDAVMRTPTTEYEENTVINVLQKGYKIGEKVLRPALVNVAATE